MIALTLSALALLAGGLIAHRFFNADTRTLLIGLVISYVAGLSGYFLSISNRYAMNEYWTEWATSVTYKEGWTEIITTTDSKGRTSRTVINHPEQWWLSTPKNKVTIDKKGYQELATRWGHDPAGWGHLGIEHTYKWPGTPLTGEVVTTKHRYDNRPALAPSLFNYRPIAKDEAASLQLYNWATLYKDYRSRFVYYPTPRPDLEGPLSRLNADFGSKHEIRVHLLIWDDRSVEVSHDQEAFWKGGNKNELNICIGQDADRNITWARVFSWSKSEELKAEIAAFLMEQKKLDPYQLDRFLREKIPLEWQRRDFSEFNYIPRYTPTWYYWVLAVWDIASVAFITVLSVKAREDRWW